MTIKEGIKNIGKPFEIPDCNRVDLAKFLADEGYKYGAEIGTAKGVYAEILCKAGIKLIAVDPWLDHPEYHSPKGDWQKELDSQFETAKKRLAPYDCTFIRKFSMDAVKDIPDNSLDFVYIDGNHEYKFVVEDIYEWTKKVRKGGVISGHDYLHTMPREWDVIHVKNVLPSYTAAYKIKPWFVLGRSEKIEGEKRDGFRSWMWFKQ